MPKSNQPDKKSRSQPDIPYSIEIDEGIFCPRISDRISPDRMDGQLNHLIQKLEALNMILAEDEWDEEEYEYEDFDRAEFQPKIMAILDSRNLQVNLTNQKKYLAYLQQAIEPPCLLTGNQEFAWEDYYIFGPGTPKEYERKRKNQPSFMDRFKLIDFIPEISKSEGIMVAIERIGDGQKFVLPLWQLEAVETNTKNFDLINDYVTWFEYYQD